MKELEKQEWGQELWKHTDDGGDVNEWKVWKQRFMSVLQHQTQKGKAERGEKGSGKAYTVNNV